MGIIYLLIQSEHPNSIHYHAGPALVLLFGNNVVLLRFWYALAGSITLCIAYLIATPRFGVPLSPEIMVNTVIVLFSAIVLTLITNDAMERDQRENYLPGLKERTRR